MRQTPSQLILHRLAGHTQLKSPGSGQLFVCPRSGGDVDHTLRIAVKPDGTVLLYCSNGCTTKAVLRAIDPDLRESDLFPFPKSYARQGGPMTLETKLRRAGLSETEVQAHLARGRT